MTKSIRFIHSGEVFTADLIQDDTIRCYRGDEVNENKVAMCDVSITTGHIVDQLNEVSIAELYEVGRSAIKAHKGQAKNTVDRVYFKCHGKQYTAAKDYTGAPADWTVCRGAFGAENRMLFVVDTVLGGVARRISNDAMDIDRHAMSDALIKYLSDLDDELSELRTDADENQYKCVGAQVMSENCTQFMRSVVSAYTLPEACRIFIDLNPDFEMVSIAIDRPDLITL